MSRTTYAARFTWSSYVALRESAEQAIESRSDEKWRDFILSLNPRDRNLEIGLELLMEDYPRCPPTAVRGDEVFREHLTDAFLCTVPSSVHFAIPRFNMFVVTQVFPGLKDLSRHDAGFGEQFVAFEVLLGQACRTFSHPELWPFGAFFTGEHEAILDLEESRVLSRACEEGGLLHSFRQRLPELFGDRHSVIADWEKLLQVCHGDTAADFLLYARNL
jgi:hypothetical protein